MPKAGTVTTLWVRNFRGAQWYERMYVIENVSRLVHGTARRYRFNNNFFNLKQKTVNEVVIVLVVLLIELYTDILYDM